MPKVISQIATQLPQPTLPPAIHAAGETLRGLVEGDAYVGEVVALGYNDAILQIHDFHRQKVGGIPALCFLLASRVNPQTTPDARVEDSSVILLRVMDHADLPNAEEAKRVRVETAQRVSGEVGVNWDDRAVMDATTHQLLSYAGVRCRVIGTFYMTDSGPDSAPNWQLCFGSDISNYYPSSQTIGKSTHARTKMIKANTEQSRFGTAASRWAGVGPYYAMFPVSFATAAVKEHTKLGDCVFDPFAGRGTALFAAASEGRIGLGIEINPVGWVYGKAKLQTAKREDVEQRIRCLGVKAKNYKVEAKALPPFFHSCFSREVRRFLLAARDLLDWRRKKTDWTTMALLMIDLHGKRESALSNQMRQTKAMSPQYAIDWWKERELTPPERDPVEFMLKKVKWRYAKGRLDSGLGRIYLGDCQIRLSELENKPPEHRAKLLLTSPPYCGVTNYFYDQWLRFWLLGGPDQPCSTNNSCMGKFQNKQHYTNMLRNVFAKSKPLLKRNAVVYVRTDAREFTREATIEALEIAFPRKKLQSQNHSQPDFTQTALFDSELKSEGEVDFVMW